MAQVFISYSRKDLSFVEQLATDLKNAGFDAWYDVSNLGGGSRWRVEIETAIKNSQFVIVVLSPDSIASEWVEREFLFASNLDRKIIPLMYRSCELPLNYLDLNYLDVEEGNYHQNFDEILKALSADATVTILPTSKVKKLSFYKLKPEYVVAIVVAIIGGSATIIAALLGSPFIGKIFNSPVPTATIAATQVLTSTFTSIPISATPEPSLTLTDSFVPTSTPVPATDTPVPTFTLVPPVAIGKDWIAGCISTLWNIYPSNVPTADRGDGCWKEPLHVFSAENGDLDFLAERRKGPTEIYGLFAPLSESGSVTFTVRLKHLNNVDLWMGVFDEPDLASDSLLLTIPNGNIAKRSILQKDPLSYVTIQGTQALTQGNGFSISFTFTTLSASSRVNPHVFVWDPVSIPSAQKWLFLGFKGLNGSYHIEGTFLNFELK